MDLVSRSRGERGKEEEKEGREGGRGEREREREGGKEGRVRERKGYMYMGDE